MAADTIAYTGTQSNQEIRHGRGCALCRERSADIWQVAPHTYRVPSESDENTVYIVCTRKGFEFCPCTDFRERCAEQGILCKHIHAANNWRFGITSSEWTPLDLGAEFPGRSPHARKDEPTLPTGVQGRSRQTRPLLG